MTRISILQNIHNTVINVVWKNELQRTKAVKLMSSIFNKYCLEKIDFSHYVTLGHSWFDQIFTSPRDRVIKTKLIELGILQCNESYDVNKKIAKGYRINYKLFQASTLDFVTIENFNNTKKLQTSFPSIPMHSLICCTDSYFQDFSIEMIQNLNSISLIPNYLDFIPNVAKININDLKINLFITNPFGIVSNYDYPYSCSLETALQKAKSLKVDLIEFEKKWYLMNLFDFIQQKVSERSILYAHQLFDLANKNFYASRNSTNNRLDHNLTALKKELFNVIRFEGEELIEIDITNSQFAVCGWINPNLDENFLKEASEGTFYENLAKSFNITRIEAKELIIKKFAFGMHGNMIKMKEFPKLNRLYPKFIKWVGDFKKENGYKSFAIMLQKKESKIIIDGLLKILIEKGYNVFPVHDSIRVKKSEVLIVKSIAEEYFKSINFNCNLRYKASYKAQELT